MPGGAKSRPRSRARCARPDEGTWGGKLNEVLDDVESSRPTSGRPRVRAHSDEVGRRSTRSMTPCYDSSRVITGTALSV